MSALHKKNNITKQPENKQIGIILSEKYNLDNGQFEKLLLCGGFLDGTIRK